MTSKEEDTRVSEKERELQQEGEDVQPKEEPDHPGWLSLAEILKKPHPVFEKSKFLIGYHFSCNIYVLGGDYFTIVDPGNDYTGFLQLFQQGFNPAEIKKIVLTHGHRDHAMGTFELLRYPPIMERKDLQIILHKEGPVEFKQMVREIGHTFTEVTGGETLELSGFEWEVMHTPGHTIDGISLYHAPTKTAITGDVVIPHAMADIDKNAGGRLDHYLYAMRLLLSKDIETILPGHGVPVATDGRTAMEQTYEGLLMRILGVEDQKTTWIEGATSLAQKGLLDEALFCCNKELARGTANEKALHLKALCLNDLGRCEEAIEVLDKILERRSDDVTALVAKGHALLGLGKYDESLKYFDAVLAISPNIKDAQVFKGMALYLSGRYDDAMDIEAFRSEFMGRFKDELSRFQQQGKEGSTEPES
ncbi:MAG: MBL fold metallo-hydrolase [Syntrophobacteria bacterium]